MALPGTHDLTGDNALYRGDFYGEAHVFTDDDTGLPLDLSGRTWTAQIRTSQDESAAVLATLTVDATNAATGTIRVTLPGSQAGQLTASSAYWDLQAVLVSDPENVRTWLRGDVEVEGDATR